MDERSASELLTLVTETARGRAADGKADRKAALAGIEARYDEVEYAMQWLADNERVTDALRMAGSLASFWMATKRLDEGATWFERLLAVPGGDDSVRGTATFQAGLLAIWLGRDERATELHTQALAIGRRIGDPSVMAQALTGLARVRLRGGDTVEARRLCHEALEVTEGSEDRSGRANAQHVLGVAAQMAGDFQEAKAVMSERIAYLEEVGAEAGVAAEASNLSMVERQLGNLDGAYELSRRALEIYTRRGDAWSTPWALSGLAAVATARGEFERGATLIGAAEAMVDAQGSAWPPDERPHYEKTLAMLENGMGAEALAQARSTGRALSLDDAVALALASEGGSG